ncbi:gnat family protein [Pyrenophora tritici-repentis]|uniref:Acetyltransferase domain containing protein n=1 Tax=Pyrenophora tritici-repentis TaxID=45151 RepID=A0A2W1FBZ9_9PLEO|nr:gnat family protein [Pyrenophora tritici-repentis]KAF7452179.1 gnat family protein [Pyrenophora tritici-repentis]KAF7574704.1 putative gnat family protein [Pyrenophora tritici-repentis]KAG9386522.1 gnat family protein [Pyrenophora tritici-repentis]KAI0571483.1 gnat family protein [Pyrenophora tritici-repentis]
MPLEVHRITDPSDFEAFVDIQLAAFQDGGGITAFLSPNPSPADYRQKIIDRQIQSLKEEPDLVFLKVIDTELDGKMIACAKWRINTEEKTEEQVKKMCPGPDEKDKENPALVDFWAFLSRVRKQYMGTKPFYFLHLLVTNPHHQRRGAGALLVGWGTKRADEAQLPSFLESSPVGRRLYTKMGFQTVEVVTFDLAKYGSSGTDESHVMIRPKPQ